MNFSGFLKKDKPVAFTGGKKGRRLEKWNVAATGPGAYRLVFLCEQLSPFDDRWGEDILLTSEPFQLQ